MKLRLAFPCLLAFIAGASTPDARAQDASFGCKVLLCAAATSPDWSAIPYCVPVMQSLFSILNSGGDWPSCPEGSVSAPVYQPYLACPAGMTAETLTNGAGNHGDIAWVPDPNGATCFDLAKPQTTCNQGSCVTTYPSVARQPNPTPYSVTITTANGAQVFSFSLSR